MHKPTKATKTEDAKDIEVRDLKFDADSDSKDKS